MRAEFDGKAYEWTLTYRGGRNHCDIMLTDPRIAAADGKMVPYVAEKQARSFQFDRAVVESAYREFYRHSDAQQPRVGGTLAFPGAEGYGAYAQGGRGGKVLFVTNLNDSGPGSLREAVEAKGLRTVIFRVGGVIETKGLMRPGTSTRQRPPYFIIDPKVILPGSIYVDGNIMVGMVDVGRDNWKGVLAERSLQSPAPFPAPQVQTQSAAEAFELVLRNAGATRPRRDSVDARIVSDVRNGTGKIINDEKEVGGWPTYASGEPPENTANDGIPDEWKKTHGLSLNDPSVASAINAAGYTELEVYLNSIVVPRMFAAPAPRLNMQPPGITPRL